MSNPLLAHQFVSLTHGNAADETLLADRVIRFLYSTVREEPSMLQQLAATPLASMALATWEFDRRLINPKKTIARAARRMGINLRECIDDLGNARTLRELFERRIAYESVRPMPADTKAIISPADGKALAIGFAGDAMLPVKQRFISARELLGREHVASGLHFNAGLVVRLTPDMYHYVHAPVSGVVRAHYWIEGALHSCNPGALVCFQRPYAMNRRRVTIIDTDVEAGSQVGAIALVNVAAMMIGRIDDAYSVRDYADPQSLTVGAHVARGQPLALFRPGSSTSIILWDGERARHTQYLRRNANRIDVRSRFSDWLLSPWVETAVSVRSLVAHSC